MYVQRLLADTFDVPDTNLTYPRLSEYTLEGGAPIKTTGSTATTDAAVASTNPFSEVGAGDVLYYTDKAMSTLTRTVISKASADQVVVDAAWDLGGVPGVFWRWRKLSSGTAATSGLVSVEGLTDILVAITVETYNVATNITAQVEGVVAPGMTPSILEDPQGNPATNTFTATGSIVIPIGTLCESLRVGFKLTGADSGLNQVTVWVGGQRVLP